MKSAKVIKATKINEAAVQLAQQKLAEAYLRRYILHLNLSKKLISKSY
jgi:hypothetical protein